MITFPACKINLGLRITGKRPDGFHDLQSCFYPVGWGDMLEVIPAREFSFSSSGLPIPGNSQQNLCVRAYNLLKADFDLPPVQMHLHKIVPIGAGLGGGSADAAFTLKLLNRRILPGPESCRNWRSMPVCWVATVHFLFRTAPFIAWEGRCIFGNCFDLKGYI